MPAWRDSVILLDAVNEKLDHAIKCNSCKMKIPELEKLRCDISKNAHKIDCDKQIKHTYNMLVMMIVFS